LGDIPALAESIERIGLLHPIIVTTDYELVVGRRRLAAHEHLGRSTIEARVVDLDDPLAAEFDENEQRKAYTPSERVAIGEAREERDRQEAVQRKSEGERRPAEAEK
jgi:ParB family chromosome partitioning protein